MHTPNLEHSTHDLDLIAADAAGDVTPAEQPIAEAQLASCTQCRALKGDLVALARATHELPAPFARTRDFQIDPARAQRLRRGSWLRNLLRPFGATGSPVRPLAAAFTTLGLAGILVAGALPGLLGGNGATERDSSGAGTTSALAATSAPAEAPGVAQAPNAGKSTPGAGDSGAASSPGAPNATDLRAVASAGAVAMGGGAQGSFAGESSNPLVVTPAPAAPNPILLGSIALLGVGLVLFGLRYAGRRVR